MGFAASTVAVVQSKTWDCSAASLAWLLNSIGRQTSEDDAIGLLGPSRVNAASGLLDATGGGVTAALAQIGLSAQNGPLDFGTACGLAGSVPLMVGGVGWDHWTGVRGCDGSSLQLANPSPGWMGVGDQLGRDRYAALGPFYGVWLPGYGAGGTSAPGPSVDPLQAISGLPAWVLVAAAAAAVMLLVD